MWVTFGMPTNRATSRGLYANCTFVLFLCTFFWSATPAQAATITVNTLDGEYNEDGDCSLYEAMAAADNDSARDACPAGSGADTIDFSVTGLISTFDPLPFISQDLTILGPGADKLAITGNDIIDIFQVGATAHANLSGLTIADGYANQGSAVYNFGVLTLKDCVVDSSRAVNGVIYNNANATLTIDHCTILNNDDFASGIGAIVNDGALTVQNSTFSGNFARSTTVGGGAILNNAQLAVLNSTFKDNRTNHYGGAIYNQGDTTITNSSFVGNNASRGGALANINKMKVTGSTIESNQAALYGGGIYTLQELTVINSTLRGNSVTSARGGGIYSEGKMTVTGSTFKANHTTRGGAIFNRGESIISSSTFEANIADDMGGACWSDGTLIIQSSTFINNEAGSHGGGCFNYGLLLIINSTLTDNIARTGEGHSIYSAGTLTINNSTITFYVVGPSGGGTIYNENSYSITLRNTIVANGVQNCKGQITDAGSNLDSGNSCSFSIAAGSLLNTDPKLGPLANNGGATQTHALQADSPAIDAGDEITCADPATVNRQDQRGVARPQGVRCDIGAYEFVSAKEIRATAQGLPITALAFPVELAGSNNPAPLTFTVENARPTGAFAWSVQSDAAWLQASPAFGNNTPVTVKLEADIATLPPGVHTAHVRVVSTDPAVVNSPYLITVSLELVERNNNNPILRIGQRLLGFEATVGASSPLPQFFTIDNFGGGSLQWQAAVNTEAQGWLKINGSNTLNGTAPATINVQANSSGLSAGTYVGVITVNSINTTTPAQTITVVFVVQRGPTLDLTTRKVVLVGRQNAIEPAPQAIGVRNRGAGTFTWSASENSNWLTLNFGPTSLPGVITATVSMAGLNVGTYKDQITVSSPTAADSPANIETVLGVLPGPMLAVDRTTLAFDMTLGRGNPTPGQIGIRNASLGTLIWSASEDIPWLEFAQPAGGQLGSGGFTTLQAIVIDSMPVGVHTGKIVIRSANAAGSPQEVNVTLTVANPVAYCNVQAGGIDLLYTTQVKLRLNVVTLTNTPAGCHLTGELRLSLPQNANLVTNVEGDARLENGKAVFSGNANSELVMEIANWKLRLAKQNLVIREEIGLTLNSTGWEVPALFGGGLQAAGLQMTIGPKGVAVSGQRTFDLPNLNWGSFGITQNKAEVLVSGDGQYQLKVNGLVRMSIPGSGDVTSRIELKLDKQGIRTGAITAFTIPKFAGLDLQVFDAKVSNDRLTIGQARLKVPAEWGGLYAAVSAVTIRNNGAISFGGAEFRLPDIKAGGSAFQLTSLAGKLQSRSGGGYQIEASGAFGMAGLPNGRSCQMGVLIVLHTDGNGARVLEIQSATQTPAMSEQDTAVNGLQLDRFRLNVHCRPGWPIATTGFSLTGVEGDISLVHNDEYVAITMWIESDWRFGQTPIISTVPKVVIHPKPFQIAFSAPIKVVNFESVTSDVDVGDKSFSAALTFDFKVLHGGFQTKAGLKNQKFYFNGSGFAEFSIKKGSIARECIRYIGCADIPPRTYTLDRTDAYFDLDQVELSKKILGYRVTLVYDFHSGQISVYDGLLAQTITGEQIVAAQQGVAAAMVQAEGIHFAEDGVLVDLPVPQHGAEIQAADVITPYNVPRSDVFFVLVQPLTETLQLHLIDPNGQEITPDALPSNVQYEQTGLLTTTQSLYTVAEATPGTWQTKIIGNTQGKTDFFVHYAVNTPPPLLSDLSFQATSNPNQVQINWRLSAAEANTQVNIYAATPPLYQTVTYTNVDGTQMTADTPRFAGIPLQQNLPSALNGTLQSAVVDLSALPSGEYAFWLEASGNRGGAQRCFIGINNSCDQSGLQAHNYLLDHTGLLQASSAWSPAINATIDSAQGDMFVEWDLHPHPDIANYLLHLRTTDPFTPSVTITREYLVGPVNGSRGYALVSNIEPGQTYYISIGAQDLYHGQTIWSAEQALIAPQPQFLLTVEGATVSNASITTPILTAGGPPVATSFSIEMASDLPDPIVLDVDYQRLADGLYVNFPSPVVLNGQTQSSVIANLMASATLTPGTYILPLIARSGRLEQTLDLLVTVVNTSVEGNRSLYLPVIRR